MYSSFRLRVPFGVYLALPGCKDVLVCPRWSLSESKQRNEASALVFRISPNNVMTPIALPALRELGASGVDGTGASTIDAAPNNRRRRNEQEEQEDVVLASTVLVQPELGASPPTPPIPFIPSTPPARQWLAVSEELQPPCAADRRCLWRECACDLWQRSRTSRQSAGRILLVWLSTANARLFAADKNNHRVQVFDVDSGELLHTLGESGVAGSDEKHFNYPFGVAVDEAGNLFVCDCNNKRVCVFDASLGFVRSFGQDVLNRPKHVCFNSRSQVLVSDGALHQVLIFDQDGKVQHRIGTENKCGADNAHFYWPRQIAIDQQDRLFVADRGNHRVQVFDADFKFIATIGSYTTTKEDGKFNFTFSVAVNASNTELFVGDYHWTHSSVQHATRQQRVSCSCVALAARKTVSQETSVTPLHCVFSKWIVVFVFFVLNIIFPFMFSPKTKNKV